MLSGSHFGAPGRVCAGPRLHGKAPKNGPRWPQVLWTADSQALFFALGHSWARLGRTEANFSDFCRFFVLFWPAAGKSMQTMLQMAAYKPALSRRGASRGANGREYQAKISKGNLRRECQAGINIRQDCKED